MAKICKKTLKNMKKHEIIDIPCFFVAISLPTNLIFI